MMFFLLVGILFFSLSGMVESYLPQGVGKKEDKFFPKGTIGEYYRAFGREMLTGKVVQKLEVMDFGSPSSKQFFDGFFKTYFLQPLLIQFKDKNVAWFGSEIISQGKMYTDISIECLTQLNDPRISMLCDYGCGVPLEKDGQYGKTRRNFFLQENSLLKFGSIYANKEIQDCLSQNIKTFSDRHSIGFPVLPDNKVVSCRSSFDLFPVSFLTEFFIKSNMDKKITVGELLNFVNQKDVTYNQLPTISGVASLRNALLSFHYFFEDAMVPSSYLDKVSDALRLAISGVQVDNAQSKKFDFKKNFINHACCFQRFEGLSYYFKEKKTFPELVDFLNDQNNKDVIIEEFRRAVANDNENDSNELRAVYYCLKDHHPAKQEDDQGFDSDLVKIFLNDIQDACMMANEADYFSFGREYCNNNDIFAHIRAIQMGLYYLSCIDRNKVDFSVFFNKVSKDKKQLKHHFSAEYVKCVKAILNTPECLTRLKMKKKFSEKRSQFQLNEDFLFHCLEVTTQQYCDRDHQVHRDDCVFCQHALEYNKGIQKKIEHIDGIFTMFFGEEHGYASLVTACLSNKPDGITFDTNNGISLPPEYRKKHGVHQLSSPLCMETFSSTMALCAARMKVIEGFLMDEQKKITDAKKFFKEKDKADGDAAILFQLTTAFTQELQRVHNLFQCFSGEDLILYQKEFLAMDESSENHELYDGMLKSIFYETGFEKISLAPVTLLSYVEERLKGLKEKKASIVRLEKTIDTETQKPYSFFNHFGDPKIGNTVNTNFKAFIREMFLEETSGSPLCCTLQQKKKNIDAELERLTQLRTLINNDQLPLLMERYTKELQEDEKRKESEKEERNNEPEKKGRELRMSGTTKMFFGVFAAVSGGLFIKYMMKRGKVLKKG